MLVHRADPAQYSTKSFLTPTNLKGPLYRQGAFHVGREGLIWRTSISSHT